MKCKECKYLVLETGNGTPSRYYCEEKEACKEALVGGRLVSRCDRGSNELKIKGAPRWCKLNKRG